MLVPVVIGAGLAEELKLGLLEFTRSKDEGLGGYLVAEAFANLGDTEGDLDPCGIEYVSEIGEDSLGRLRAKIQRHRVVDVGSHLCLEHQLKRHGLCKPTDRVAVGTNFIAQILGFGQGGVDCNMLGVLLGLLGDLFLKVVDPGSGIALFTFSDEVGELVGVAGGLPYQRVHKYAAIEADNVVPHLYDRLPPRASDVIFQFDTERAVVIAACQSAVDFAGLKDEAPSLAKRYDVIELCNFSHNVHSIINKRLII